MKTLCIDGWTGLKVVHENSEDRTDFTRGKVREGGVITVTSRAVECSCVTALDSCAYLRSSGAQEIRYGTAGSALDRALELAISALREGEAAEVRVSLKGEYVDGGKDEVTLKCKLSYALVSQGMEAHEHTASQKLEVAARCNESAVKVLRDSNPAAENKYPTQLSAFLLVTKALKWLAMEPLEDLPECEREERLSLETRCYSNLSHLHLAFGHDERALAAASLALERSPDGVKALYRRAVANTNLQNFEAAEADLQSVLKGEPSNGAAKRQMKLIREKRKIVDDKYAEAMKKFLAF